jgi:hypothetical protein
VSENHQHADDSTEPRQEDLELGGAEAAAVAGGDKSAKGHVEIKDISVTKSVDVASAKLD